MTKTQARARSIAPIGLMSIGLMSTVCATAAPAGAQTVAAKPVVRQQAALTSGRVSGLVRDERGAGVPGVSISAIGTTMAMAVSDATGHFVLPLPSGEYVIRAHREGYSSYRDLVLIRPSSAIERTITVTRTGVRPVMVAGITGIANPATSDDAVQPPSRTAWYLSHLKRPILRDSGAVVAEAVRSQSMRTTSGSLFDRALSSSARLATAFFADTDFSGQVNFLTASAIDPSIGWGDPQVPRNVAYLSVSAPIGGVGDWRVRGALNATDLSSWVMLGEFVSREDQAHAYTVGMSYSTQTFGDERSALISTLAAGESRSAGAIYGGDRWHVNRRLDLDYGLRWDRYAYVADAPNMVSPRLAARQYLFGRTSVVGEAAQRMVAPGSAEFLAPAAAGPWLPPERTFSTLSPDGQFRAERVRHYAVGVRQDFAGGRFIAVRRFHQSSDDQATTVFGLDREGTAWTSGHYSVAAIGNVAMDGWSVRASGALSPRVTGTVEYSYADAEWMASPTGTRRVRAVAPSAMRVGTEHLHDVLTTVDVDIPESDTRVSVAYRVNSAFSRAGLGVQPGLGARFDMQINQALPFQPVRGGRLEVLVAVSNLLRDLRQAGSLYDELLTVSPPLRFLGGVQIRF
jgi:hypothetical protein